MRKIRLVQIVGILLVVVYCILLCLDVIFNGLGNNRIILLSLVLAGIAVNMIVKGVIIRSGSTLWFAITLVISAIAVIIFSINTIDLNKYYYVFAILPIIASLINLVIFQNLIYIRIIIINVSILIPILLYSFVDLALHWVWLIGSVSVIGGIIVCRMIITNKENV